MECPRKETHGAVVAAGSSGAGRPGAQHAGRGVAARLPDLALLQHIHHDKSALFSVKIQCMTVSYSEDANGCASRQAPEKLSNRMEQPSKWFCPFNDDTRDVFLLVAAAEKEKDAPQESRSRTLPRGPASCPRTRPRTTAGTHTYVSEPRCRQVEHHRHERTSDTKRGKCTGFRRAQNKQQRNKNATHKKRVVHTNVRSS